MASRAKVAAVVGMLAESYDRKLSAVQLEGYFVGIGDLSDEAIEAAGTAVLRGNFAFMPKPGELRALAMTGGVGFDGCAEQAWAILNTAIRRLGSGRSVNFRDAAINATVRALGGWEHVCSLEGDAFTVWYRKEFLATYTKLVQSGIAPGEGGYLIGFNERNNQAWVGQLVPLNPLPGHEQKAYQHPTPNDIGSPYKPAIESKPARQQITHRPAELPRLELKKV